jgi:hypothetical protein
VVIDEAAIVPNLEQAWQEGVRPMLADHKGEAWFMSTPKGTASYFYTLFQKGQGMFRGEWRSWRMPTSCNPHIDPTEILAAKEDLTELAYAQEYLAQFVSWSGQVFRRILDAVSTSPMTGKAACIGVDWGRVNDYTVFAVVSDAGELMALDRSRGAEYSLQRARLQALYERFGKPLIIAEANSIGQPVIEQLQRDGLKVRPFVTTNASKSEAVEALALAFERGEIRILDDPILVGELQSFEAKPLPSGLMRYQAAANGHDDTVMALALGWQGVIDGRRPPKFDPAFGAELAQANASLTGMAAVRAGEAGDYGLGDDMTFSGSSDPWAKKWSM